MIRKITNNNYEVTIFNHFSEFRKFEATFKNNISNYPFSGFHYGADLNGRYKIVISVHSIDLAVELLLRFG